jgi:ammonium transporter, Amt family
LVLDVPYTGEIAARATVNSSLAGAAAACSALFTNLYWEERTTGEYSFNLTKAMNGALSGLVAITGSCGVIDNWAAVLIGIVSGWLYLWGSSLLIRWKLDDAVDAIPVHMINGAWGVLASGFFSKPEYLLQAYGNGDHPGLFYSWGQGEFDMVLLGIQFLEILFVFGWSFSTMTPFFMFLNHMGWFRSDSLEELVGLDEVYHGGKHNGDEVVEETTLAALIKNRNRNNR